jgi:hypothetical protein
LIKRINSMPIMILPFVLYFDKNVIIVNVWL